MLISLTRPSHVFIYQYVQSTLRLTVVAPRVACPRFLQRRTHQLRLSECGHLKIDMRTFAFDSVHENKTDQPGVRRNITNLNL